MKQRFVLMLTNGIGTCELVSYITRRYIAKIVVMSFIKEG